MTLLIISPDYASHLLPLATLGTAWRDAGERVVVATGPATADIVSAFDFERVNLQLGKGSNPGVIRAADQPKGEDDALRGFFDATRRGMIETLMFQAQARLSDLMWEPVRIGREVQAIVDDVRADTIIVDHLAFSARVALAAYQIPYADVVLGHPSALPVGTEVYGYPPAWPAAFTPSTEQLAELRELCERVSGRFTAEWNAALLELNPMARASTSAFSERGDVLLLNYPQELVDASTSALLEPRVFLGSAVREEPIDDQVQQWLASSDEPVVYVSFGSFLSVRGDVLGRVASALKPLGVRVAIALGSADRAELGELPESWLVREFLPQVTLLAHSVAAVTHGGNNSVTEAVRAGVPMVVLPFSTDQFAGAAALESAEFGICLDPNAATLEQLRDALVTTLGTEHPRLTELGQALRQDAGRDRARAALGAPNTN